MREATFGPFYPPELQPTVTHAERQAQMVERLLKRAHPEAVRVALTERASEIHALVEDVVGEWRAGRCDAARASEIIGRHVESVHAVLRRCFGGAFLPNCCARAPEATEMGTVLGADAFGQDSSTK